MLVINNHNVPQSYVGYAQYLKVVFATESIPGTSYATCHRRIFVLSKLEAADGAVTWRCTLSKSPRAVRPVLMDNMAMDQYLLIPFLGE